MLDSTATPAGLVLALGLLLLPFLFHLQKEGWPRPKNLNLHTFLPRLRLRPNQSSEIISLRMYPIKSCRGFEVTSTTLKEHGLDLDRRWMLVDASTHEFLTIRQIPDMTRISTALSPDGSELIISIPITKSRNKTIQIPSHPTPEWLETNTTIAPVKIWDNDTDGYVHGSEINDPFSAFLGRDVCLVYKGPTPRVLKGNGAPSLLGRVQTTGFPDVFPVLIASEASLKELNGRLEKIGVDPITVERFRPNIVVRGEAPWVEDSWKTVRIRRGGESSNNRSGAGSKSSVPLDLDIVARCARCQVPNVDPETAAKHKKQPWDTLMSYRRVDEGIKWKPCFGMLSAPRSEGVVEVGMSLEVLEETREHRYITGF
ncbi:MOSC N-terminal beta barrel [Penicillium argentinense]|uniref:MOSC N-terminal beta barrel n=1 Tax=Penicillium argentinense TaxID=1131581 RepID=A0A9W9FM02_9EURO|nr:MOSC N-terminal beta barrel [Penicillium argentinense]KAJ5102668.1 MOSC N-terminal beta barrel [Penicillium argentinense]